jgi:hypothetical protein
LNEPAPDTTPTLWGNTVFGAIRLMGETSHLGIISETDLAELAESMDLELQEAGELLDDAGFLWDDLKVAVATAGPEAALERLTSLLLAPPTAPASERCAPERMRVWATCHLWTDNPKALARSAARQSAVFEEARALGLKPEREEADDGYSDLTVEGTGARILGLLAALQERGEAGFLVDVPEETAEETKEALWKTHGTDRGGSGRIERIDEERF